MVSSPFPCIYLKAKETWGRHCDFFAVVTTATDPSFDLLWLADLKGDWLLSRAVERLSAPLISFRLACTGIPESKQALWYKSRTGYMRAYEEYVLTNKIDWIVRGDDDTFFVCRLSCVTDPVRAGPQARTD